MASSKLLHYNLQFIYNVSFVTLSTALFVLPLLFLLFLLLLYYRFVKMKFFKIWGNIILFCWFAFFFFFFFTPANVSQPFLDQFAPNLAQTCRLACDLYWGEQFSKSSKTRSQRPKKHRNVGQFFAPAVTFRSL